MLLSFVLMVSVQSYVRVDVPYYTCTLMQSILIIFKTPEDKQLLVKLFSGPDMADVASLTDFLPELYPKS